MIKRLLAIAGAALLLSSSSASAASLSVTGTNGADLSASATFNAVAGVLTVVLTNTSAVDVLNPAQVLTAVFFNIAPAANVTSSALDAKLTAGSSVTNGGTTYMGNGVGGEWGYGVSLAGAPGGATNGISSSGFGLFGGPNFCASSCVSLDPPDALDGVNYGITSAGDNTATGNGGINTTPLIKNSVTFTLQLAGVGAALFNAAASISNVSFQYGTALSECNIKGNNGTTNCTPTTVPEPSSLFLLGTGLLGAVRFYRRYQA